MSDNPRKRHPTWKYEDHGPSEIDDSLQYFGIEDFNIVAWSPDPIPGRSPATQVHVLYHLKELDEFRFVQRFKTADALDAFIRLLAEYRRHVWGGDKPKE